MIYYLSQGLIKPRIWLQPLMYAHGVGIFRTWPLPRICCFNGEWLNSTEKTLLIYVLHPFASISRPLRLFVCLVWRLKNILVLNVAEHFWSLDPVYEILPWSFHLQRKEVSGWSRFSHGCHLHGVILIPRHCPLQWFHVLVTREHSCAGYCRWRLINEICKENFTLGVLTQSLAINWRTMLHIFQDTLGNSKIQFLSRDLTQFLPRCVYGNGFWA